MRTLAWRRDTKRCLNAALFCHCINWFATSKYSVALTWQAAAVEKEIEATAQLTQARVLQVHEATSALAALKAEAVALETELVRN